MEIEEGPVASVHIITLKSVLKKVTNWKTPGHDGIHGFWFKKFTSIHKKNGSATEQMSTRNRSTRLDDKRDNYPNPERPTKRKHPQQL